MYNSVNNNIFVHVVAIRAAKPPNNKGTQNVIYKLKKLKNCTFLEVMNHE